MRANGRRLAEVAARVEEHIAPGVTTLELDRIAHALICSMGARPSFLGYAPDRAPPFPATICASVNEAVVHGVPDARPLERGDVLSVDLGLCYGGYHADMAFTVIVGEGGGPEHGALLDVARASLHAGIAMANPNNRVGDISAAIESTIRAAQFGIIRQFCRPWDRSRAPRAPPGPQHRQAQHRRPAESRHVSRYRARWSLSGPGTPGSSGTAGRR